MDAVSEALKSLTHDELEDIKDKLDFEGHIEDEEVLQGIKDGGDLAKVLENMGKISLQDQGFLVPLLNDVGREDIADQLQSGR